MQHLKFENIENKEEIIMNVIKPVKEIADIEEIRSEVSTRPYNAGEITHYVIIFENGERTRIKNEPFALINKLEKLANVTICRVSKTGGYDSKLMGWVLKTH